MANTIRQLIKESILKSIETLENDTLFNYYTSKKDLEETNWNFKVPKRKYGDIVIDRLVNIITESEGISEKSFSQYDNAIERAKQMVLNNPKAIEIVEESNSKKHRPQLCAELIFAMS